MTVKNRAITGSRTATMGKGMTQQKQNSGSGDKGRFSKMTMAHKEGAGDGDSTIRWGKQATLTMA